MSIKVNIAILNEMSADTKKIASKVGMVASDVRSIKYGISSDMLNQQAIGMSLNHACGKIEHIQDRLDNLSCFLTGVGIKYSEGEERIKALYAEGDAYTLFHQTGDMTIAQGANTVINNLGFISGSYASWQKLNGLNKVVTGKSSEPNWFFEFGKNAVGGALGFGKDVMKGAAKAGFKWGGVAFSALGVGLSILDNSEEVKNGEITAERAVQETIMETTVDWAKGMIIGAAIGAVGVAVVASAPISVPAIAVTDGVALTTAAVTAGVDYLFYKTTGRELTETISDGILDTTVKLNSGITNGLSNLFNVGKAVTKGWGWG